MARLYLALLVMVWVSVHYSVQEDYIVKLLSDCEYSKSGARVTTAMLTLKVDLPYRSVAAKAKCLNNTKDFERIDETTYTLPVYYDVMKIGWNNCVFRNVSSYIFSTKVLIAYGTPGSYLQQYREEYDVTCVMDNEASNTSDLQMGEGIQTAKENIATNAENVSMTIIDALGEDITATSIAIGSIVNLKAMAYGGPKGILASSCSAVGDNGRSYQFLRGGCGDGMVIDGSSGFDAIFTEAVSEPFEFFGIEEATTISFYCNFTVCETKCQKNSCYFNPKNRGKQNADRDISGHWIMAHTGSVRWLVFPENSLPSRNTGVETKPIGRTDGERAFKDKILQTIVAETNEFRVLDENDNTAEAETEVFSFLQPDPKMKNGQIVDKKLDFSRNMYSNTAIVFKIVLAVVACLCVLSISLSLYLIRSKKVFVNYNVTNA